MSTMKGTAMKTREQMLEFIKSLGYEPGDVAQIVMTPGATDTITVMHHPNINRETRTVEMTATRHDLTR